MQSPFKIPIIYGVDPQPWMLLGLGLLLVLFGRRIYWLFFACIGFLLGSLPLQYLIDLGTSAWWWQLLPLAAGLVSAFLVVFVKKKALRVAGLLSGAYLGYTIAEFYLVQPWPLLAMLLVGLLAYWLVLPMFNGFLVLLSSCLGAHLILVQTDLPQETRLVGWGFIALLGIWLQAKRERTTEGSRRTK